MMPLNRLSLKTPSGIKNYDSILHTTGVMTFLIFLNFPYGVIVKFRLLRLNNSVKF